MLPTRSPFSLSSCHRVCSRISYVLLNVSACFVASYVSKSRMPCRPGPLPVMNVVHAAGVMGGCVERSTPDTPPTMNRCKFGIRPA